MADADRELGVKVKTTADTSGVKEVGREIESVDKKTQAADKTNKDAGKTTDELTGKKNRLREALKGLAVQFPELARVVSFVTSPITILAAAVATVTARFLEWKRAIEETSRKQSELIVLRDSLNSVAQIMLQMEGAKFAKAIDAIGTAAKSAVKELDKLNRSLDETRGRADTLDDLRRDIEKQAIEAKVASGDMSETEGKAAIADIDNKYDEKSAQRQFRALQQKKKNQEQALREIEPQLARLRFTPEEDMAKLEQQANRSKGRAGQAASDLATLGPNLLEQIKDAQADITVMDRGGVVSIKDYAKYGIVNPLTAYSQVQDYVGSKQREYDVLVKNKAFEAMRAEKAEQKLTGARSENQQIESLRGTQEDLRQGITDTDAEIKTTTDFNRESLRLKRVKRGLEVETHKRGEERKEREKEEKEQQKLQRGFIRGGGGGGGYGGGDVDTGELSGSQERTTSAVKELVTTVTAYNETVQALIEEAISEIKRQGEQIKDNRVD